MCENLGHFDWQLFLHLILIRRLNQCWNDSAEFQREEKKVFLFDIGIMSIIVVELDCDAVTLSIIVLSSNCYIQN